MCQDKSTCSQLIPVVSILVDVIASEVKNRMNAAFHDELETMLLDCRKRLQTLVENEFLVMSSLLDPRYTSKVESLLNKQFRQYFAKFSNLAKSFQEEEISVDDMSQREDQTITQVNGDQEEAAANFWNVFGNQSFPDNQQSSQREIEDQFEA